MPRGQYERKPPPTVAAGEKYAAWTVVKPTHRRKYFECLCECGTVREVRDDSLLSGGTRSCGCIGAEKASKRAKELFTTHGLTQTKVWSAHKDMRSRCYNPKCRNYKNYGAKGVTVCDRWLEEGGFLNFVEDMGMPEEGDTLERISVKGNYEPGNCKWEGSLSVQGFNKRLNPNNTSGKTGVRVTRDGTWQAYINKDKKFYSLGCYRDINDAIAARRAGELEHYGFYQEDTDK